MHQEISRREKVSIIKLALTILIAATVLITMNTLLVAFELNSALTDWIIIIATVALTYAFIRQNMTSYKYCLIDDDLIIWEIIGTKEKRILNMNINQIIRFAHVKEESYSMDKGLKMSSHKKLYNCLNNENRHYLIYEDESMLKRWITIQPSDCMVDLINERLAK